MHRALVLIALLPTIACVPEPAARTYEFPDDTTRVWIGPDFYANRLQDWRINDGRLEAIEGSATKPMRSVHLLTTTLGEGSGSLNLSVRLGQIAPGNAPTADTWAGFLVGAGGEHVDYRISSLVHHWPSEDGGLIVAIDGRGQIVVRDNSVMQGYKAPRANIPIDAWPQIEPESSAFEDLGDTTVRLELQAGPEASGEDYWLHVTAADSDSGRLLGTASYAGIPAAQLTGNLALVSHRSTAGAGPGYWFDDWTLAGSKLVDHPERAFGPVMGAFHTLSGGILKMTAQFGPLGPSDPDTAELQVERAGNWETVSTATIDPLSATATFRVEGWDETLRQRYRVAYDLRTGPETSAPHIYEGVIRAVPDKDEFVLAALNCHHISGGDGQWNHSHFWFPHNETVEYVASHQPDMLFFAGDQIYESGLEGIVRKPLETAALDYLGHWFRFVWAFGDLARDVPTVMIPDDHDVYHGNIWGAGGIKAEGPLRPVSDNGGYIMDAEWVNAVHRTQVSNLPDPVDPAPIEQDISVYFTRIEYGGLSFAVVADRMFKSSPSLAVPAGEVVNGWPRREGFDPRQADVPGAVLLGDRQLRFLDQWVDDWTGDAWMKVLLSQTLFSNLATIPEDAQSGEVLPGLENPAPDNYPTDFKLAADMDSNGWPQSGRNRALRILRRGFAFHVVGDQHLGSFVHYGIDEFNDAGYGFVVPSIANIWPRRWFPPYPGRNRDPGAPPYTGEYLDGFGNRMTVHAVANPVKSGREPSALYDRVPGYGIVRFRRDTREIVSENWPRWMDPREPDALQYTGWPVTVAQQDNYGRAPVAYLPSIVVTGMQGPVVQVVDQLRGRVVYTLRIRGTRIRPWVFEQEGVYTVRVGEPGTQSWRELADLQPGDDGATITVEF